MPISSYNPSPTPTIIPAVPIGAVAQVVGPVDGDNQTEEGTT